MANFDINSFIDNHITKRSESFFKADIDANADQLKKEIENKNVLVIGGGGTIGSNYIKAILRFNPQKVIVIDTNENGLTELVRDVRSTRGLKVPVQFLTYPVNFGDAIFDKIYQFHKPFDIIANFAAHKHVRSEKDSFSVQAMIQNNIFYAQALLNLIRKDNPSHFFCVSTDKAANPVNIMGATKKIMEDLVMQSSSYFKSTTARFANVAFSNGSLLDGFMKRIMNYHPLSVPSDVKRYFVSPVESGEICMLACILGKSGNIFFPKLNQDQLINFFDIAISFVEEMGFKVELCNTEEEARMKSQQLTSGSKIYPVYSFTSETTGEKLYEEFYTDNEDIDWNSYASLGVIKNSYAIKNFDKYDIDAVIEKLRQLFVSPIVNKSEIVHILKEYIPDFHHEEKGVYLDQKM
jgi:FlaA1/EpsC-like NDP-sugar epimerase